MRIKTDRAGVILLNLGSPDSLQAVKPFLYNLFSDRDVIKLGPSVLQKPLAWLLSNLRTEKAKKMYQLIGGKSPLVDITTAQAQALENLLNDSRFTLHASRQFKVYIGMRYWHPFIEDTVKQMHGDGIRSALALSLYPHYSMATAGSAISRFEAAARKHKMKYHCIPSWFDHPIYIKALTEVIKEGLASFNSAFSLQPSVLDEVHVLFSAHSLPMSIVDTGDPYVKQIKGTIGQVIKKININWHLSYQSKSGPVKWLAPSTGEKLEELERVGVKNLLVVPISFVSDHIETLYEIDILYKELANKLGIKLMRTASLNTHPVFIEALKDLVINGISEIK